MPDGVFPFKETGRKQRGSVSLIRVRPSRKSVSYRGVNPVWGFAEECVKLIRKIWFREVLDISNNEIIITDFQPSVKS